MPDKHRPAFLERLRGLEARPKAKPSRWAWLLWPWLGLEKLAGFLGHAWKALLMLVLLVLSGLSGKLLWEECHKTVAVIGRIEAPEELQKKGYTPQVLGNHLADALLAIDHESNTSMPHQHAVSDFQQADVTLADGLSLRAVLRFLKQTLRHPDIQISGDAIVDGDKLELRARVVDVLGDVHTLKPPGEFKTADIEKALAALAEQVMDAVDPYILGAYWKKLEGQSCQPKSTCEYSKAVKQFQKIINTTNHDEAGRQRIAWAYVGLANVHSLRDEPGLAAEKAKLALQFDPDNAAAHSNLASALANLGKYEEAIAQHRKAVELDLKHAPAYGNWGAALDNLGKPEEAIAQFRKAVEIDPKYAMAYNNLGLLLNYLDRPQEALDLARQAVQAGLKPGDLGDWPCAALQKLKDPAKPAAHPAEAARFGCH